MRDERNTFTLPYTVGLITGAVLMYIPIEQWYLAIPICIVFPMVGRVIQELTA